MGFNAFLWAFSFHIAVRIIVAMRATTVVPSLPLMQGDTHLSALPHLFSPLQAISLLKVVSLLQPAAENQSHMFSLLSISSTVHGIFLFSTSDV